MGGGSIGEGDGRGIVPVYRPRLPGAEQLLPYLRRIDATRVYSNYGPLSLELGSRLAGHLGLPDGGVVCAGSGTAALVAAILATAGRASAERPLAVIPAFSFIATAAAVEMCGFRPYLADVDRDSWMLDAESLANGCDADCIGLVVPIAAFGRPVPQAPWRALRDRTGLPVVIDGAASFVGIASDPHRFLGDIPVAISFHATKAFATGEGGAVAATDPAVVRRAGRAMNFGIDTIRDCRTPSLNGKMSEYHAAVGLAELDGWPDKLAAFARVAGCYRREAAAVGLAERIHAMPDIGGNYVLFRCNSGSEAARVEDGLARAGIDFRRWYGRGLHEQTYYRGCARGSLAATDRVLPLLLGLPVAPDLDDAAVRRIVAALAAAVTAPS